MEQLSLFIVKLLLKRNPIKLFQSATSADQSIKGKGGEMMDQSKTNFHTNAQFSHWRLHLKAKTCNLCQTFVPHGLAATYLVIEVDEQVCRNQLRVILTGLANIEQLPT